jgi:cold shock CspA family protein
MATGEVKNWLDEKGYGFIAEDGGADVFVHATSLPAGVKKLKPGDKVTYAVRQTDRGVQAANVRLGQELEFGDVPDLLTEAEFLAELRVIQPPLREVHKQILLDKAFDHGWVGD